MLPIVLTVDFQLNPRAEPFVPTATATKTVQHRRRNREEREAPASKHQTRPRHGEWVGRRGMGRPNPSREIKISGANGDGKRRKSVPEKYRKQLKQKIMTETTRRKKLLARKRRRRDRAGRRAKRRAESEREKVRRKELTIATHNVRMMAVDGKHGVGRASPE